MSLILKQEPENTIATPPAGKTTLFVTETNTMATKGPDGNVTQFPTVQGANTEIFYNDDGAINGDASFTFDKTTELVTVSNLTVTGTLIAGDIAVSSIANGTSNVDIVGVSGNVTVSVSGNANILTVTGTGANIAGTANISGNANVGNLGTGGLIIATGNVTGGNLTTGGQVVATGNVSGGNLTTGGVLSVTGNSNVGNLGTGGIITATGNVTGGNLVTGGVLSVTGNSNVGNLGTGGLIVATGNVTGGNLVTSGALSVTGNANVGNLGTTGNIQAGGVKTDNLYYANGSPWDLQQPAGANTYVQYNASDSFGADPLFTYDVDTEILSAPNIAGTIITAIQTNITSVGTLSSLDVTANVTGGNLVTGGVLSVTGNSNVGNLGTTGLVVATGNVTGGNLVTGGVLSVTGNSNVGNLGTAGLIVATGNVTGGNLVTGGVLSVTGNANVGNIGAAAGVFTANISANNLSTTNRVTAGNGLTVTTGGATITGNIDVTGNFNVTGNLNYSNVTDLVVGDPLIYIGANNTGNLYDLGIVASYNDGTYVHTGLARNHTNGIWTFFDGVVAEPTTVIDWANATYPAVKVGSLTATTTISITGNANVGNLGTSGLIVATGNVTGGNLVTGGVLAATGNVSGGNLTTAGALSVTGNANVGNIGAAAGVFTGNVTAGNFVTSGSTGNISGANVISGVTLSASGQLVSTVATGTAPLAVSSTTQVANLNAATAGTAGTVTTAAQPNITSVGTLSSLAVTANLTAGNLIGVLANGNSNVNIPSANGNVNISAVGNANILVVTGTGANVTGTFNASGNVIANSKLLVGTSSTTLTNPVAVFTGSGATYSQLSMQNPTGTGSADITVYGNNGDDTQSWTDIGFTGNTFSDANYTVTAAGDGYLFVQGNSSFGGNMVIATGATGTTKDIIFATGGFLTGNIKARLYNANGAFSVTGNVVGGNVTTGGIVAATGNVTGANIVASAYTISSVGTAISAAGTVQGNATAITKDINVVSTVASGAGVVLPTAIAGMRITILNTSANALLVYPAVNGIINSLSANAAFSAPAGSKLDFLSTTTTQWYTLNATYN